MALELQGWTKPTKGVLFIVTGASGTGKTTLVRQALTRIPGIVFSISATTRPIRSGETDGKDYHFKSIEEFRELQQKWDFLESAEVYGNYYGTLKKPVESTLSTGDSILLEIDHKGAAQVRKKASHSVSIFILPPNVETMENRLRGRKTDSTDVINRRLAEAKDQLRHCGDFDYVLINDHLESAHDQFQAILISELLRKERRYDWIEQFSQ
jgi:guanylate kinase